MLIINGSTPTLVFLMVDATDDETAETGLSATVQFSKNGGSFATSTNSASEIGNGWYKIVPTSTESNTNGPFIVRATAAGANEWRDVHEVVTELVADVSNLATATNLQTVDDNVDAIKAKTDNLPAAPAATGDIPTAAANADAVWDEDLSGHTTAGSAGKALSDAGAGSVSVDDLVNALTDFDVAPVAAMNADGDVNIIIGDTFEPPSPFFDDLTIPANWAEMYLTIKNKVSEDDSAARVQIKVTNGGDAGDGLQLLNGAAATKDEAALTVNQGSGYVDVLIKDEATVQLVQRNRMAFSLKCFEDDGTSHTLGQGVAHAILYAMKSNSPA